VHGARVIGRHQRGHSEREREYNIIYAQRPSTTPQWYRCATMGQPRNGLRDRCVGEIDVKTVNYKAHTSLWSVAPTPRPDNDNKRLRTVKLLKILDIIHQKSPLRVRTKTQQMLPINRVRASAIYRKAQYNGRTVIVVISLIRPIKIGNTSTDVRHTRPYVARNKQFCQIFRRGRASFGCVGKQRRARRRSCTHAVT